MAEGNDGGRSQRSPPPASSPRRCSSSRTPQTQNDEDSELQSGEPPPSPFYEELFCSGRASASLVPLVPGALASSGGPWSDVVRRGYLGKQERGHRKFFVLRAGSHTGPSRLEWYRSQETFSAVEKSAGKAALFGSNKQGVVYLRCCLGVSRIHSSRKGHTVTLYAKDHSLVLVTEDQREQEDWYVSVKKLMEEEQREEEEHGEGGEEEDDGYCTLPPAAFFKDVWPVTVKPRGAGGSKSLAGENRLCLTATSIIMVRVGAGGDAPSVTLPLLSVRRFGHLDGSFFLELGRSAPNGPGEIWMEARDKGDQALAQRIHEAVRETIRALRVLPDFGRSPSSSKTQPQALLMSKRCRLKYGGVPGSVRPLRPPPPGNQCIFLKPQSPARVAQSSTPDSYMEMNHLGEAVSPSRSLESAEEEEQEDEEEDEESLGYMVMSPLVSPPLESQDDYVSMTSPGSSILDSDSAPLIPDQVARFRWSASVQPTETAAGTCETTIGRAATPQEVTEPEQGPSASPPPPVDHTDARALMMPPTVRGLKSSRLRHRLSACLLRCLQAEDV